MNAKNGLERYPYLMALRAIRGAIQVPANTAGDIASGVQELIAAILKALDTAFPAAACREMGFANVPLIGSVEVAVPGALDKTVRALLHVETERTPEQITHVYLHGAASLRRDIAQ